MVWVKLLLMVARYLFSTHLAAAAVRYSPIFAEKGLSILNLLRAKFTKIQQKGLQRLRQEHKLKSE